MRADIYQFEFVSKELREMVRWLERETGVEFTATSLFRIDDPGVHGQLPLRGLDLRIRHKPMGEVIERLINSVWQYDPSRTAKKCAILHGKGSHLHLHLQVHPNTKKVSL